MNLAGTMMEVAKAQREKPIDVTTTEELQRVVRSQRTREIERVLFNYFKFKLYSM